MDNQMENHNNLTPAVIADCLKGQENKNKAFLFIVCL